jgi:hypothetical protein
MRIVPGLVFHPNGCGALIEENRKLREQIKELQAKLVTLETQKKPAVSPWSFKLYNPV